MNALVFNRPEMIPPEVRGGSWTLASDWTVVFRGEYYHIPAGFRTDGASIPCALWWICGTPLEVPRLYAAIVHDFIYGGGDPEATRADADDLYRDLQIALGVSRFKAYVEWVILRMCGWTHWSAVAAVVLAVAIGGCIEIAHVDSFVNLPKDMVSFGTQSERK